MRGFTPLRSARRRAEVAGGFVCSPPERSTRRRAWRTCQVGLTLLAATIGSARAIDFEPIALHRLIGSANLVVSGRVVEVEGETFRFEVERLLIGELPGRRIAVRGFTPWPKGSARPVPYAPGQSFVLFLISNPDPAAGPPWQVPGLGGEGELPLAGRRVYLPGLSIEFLERRTESIHGAELESSSYSASCFLAAVRDYGKCFAWTAPETKPPGLRPERTCDDDALAKYRRRSRMHEYLTSATLDELQAD